MKYILTKENILTPWGVEQKYYIYKVDETDETISFVRTGISITFKKTEEGLTNFLENLVKSADTIEELCDLFVYEISNDVLNKFFFYDKNSDCFVNIHDLENILERDSVGTKFLKGAIWTGKGLIYVAKMNKKGKLELL